jgi:hypothetical protein
LKNISAFFFGNKSAQLFSSREDSRDFSILLPSPSSIQLTGADESFKLKMEGADG